MDFLIWIIILIVINSLAGGKKKPKQQPRQQTPQPPSIEYEERRSATQQSATTVLGGLMHELVRNVQEAVGEEQSQPRTPAGSRHRSGRRNNQRELTPIEQECDYCTGQNSLGDPLAHTQPGSTIVAAQPIVPLGEANTAHVDIQAMQRKLKLSDAQNAVLWQELLDKPLALRRRR